MLLLQNPEDVHKVGAFLPPVEARLRLGARAFAFADTIWGGLRRALNTNQMKAVAAGAWEQGRPQEHVAGSPFVITALRCRPRNPSGGGRGDAGFPSAQPLFGSEWISSVWVGAYCCVCFSSSLPFVLSLWPERLLKEQRGSPCRGENCEGAIIQTRKGIIGIRILLGHCGNWDVSGGGRSVEASAV